MRYACRARLSPWIALSSLAVACLSWESAQPQTTINPDISLIGDLRSWVHNDDSRPDESEVVNLGLDGVEIAVQGYLNPFARADAFFGWHGEHNAEIEEAYFTIAKGLPLGMRLRGGKYLLGFGKINPLHEHAYSFVNRPLSHEEFFGEHGLNDVGVQASIALPTGNIASEFSMDVLKGDFLLPHAHGEVAHVNADSSEEAEADSPNTRGFLARLESFIALGEFTSLSLGASGLTGVPSEDARRYTGGIDVKLKWRPDRYQSFTLGTEWIVNRNPAHHHEDHEEVAMAHAEDNDGVTSHGAFGYVDYQFRQRYNIGVLGDWTQGVKSGNAECWRIGGFAGFAPVEETTLLRVLLTYDKNRTLDEGYWSAVLQLVFSLGPHRPHAF